MTDDEYGKLTKVEQEHAFTVANVAQARVVQEVHGAIDQAVDQGTTFEDFKAQVGELLADAWGGADAMRVEMIFRTNVLQSYNEGRSEVFDHPEVRKARPFRRVDGVPDPRQCEICDPIDGTVLPVDDPFWARHQFPLHPGCRCIATALTPDEAEEEGIDESPPDHEPPAEGFGKGEDFSPDLEAFSPEIAAALRDKLG